MADEAYRNPSISLWPRGSRYFIVQELGPKIHDIHGL